jgi:S1-C subfamily serine protease
MAALGRSLDRSVVAVKSLLKAIIVSSLLVVGAASVDAQTPLGNLVSQVKSAVVIVSTYAESGKNLTHASGFFIAPDRVLTNLRFIDSAREIRITTFSGKTILVQSVIARYIDADLAILQLSQACLDVIPLKVKKVSQVNGSAVVLDNANEAQWKVTADQVGGGWSFEHLATHLKITASLVETNSGGPVVKLRGHVNGTAVSVPD